MGSSIDLVSSHKESGWFIPVKPFSCLATTSSFWPARSSLTTAKGSPIAACHPAGCPCSAHHRTCMAEVALTWLKLLTEWGPLCVKAAKVGPSGPVSAWPRVPLRPWSHGERVVPTGDVLHLGIMQGARMSDGDETGSAQVCQQPSNTSTP